MTIQVVQNIELANGMKVRAGAVLELPDQVAAALIDRGVARSHEQPGPREKKSDVAPVLNPGDPLPAAVPYVRVPAPPVRARIPGAYEDQDNFVRDLVTLTSEFGWFDWWTGGTPPTSAPPVQPSGSAENRTPILTLDRIKLHCHIEMDQDVEDDLLTMYEMAAHLHVENVLRYQIDPPVGENIQLAMLLLIAHWYRNREAVSTGRGAEGMLMPLAVKSLLSLERDYPTYS